MSCSMPALVEARHDGRLGPSEAASVERHLGVCRECAEYSAVIERVRATVREPRRSATAFEHQRIRVALLRAMAVAAPHRGRRRVLALAVGFAVLVTGCLALANSGVIARWAGPLLEKVRSTPAGARGLRIDASTGARFERTRKGDADVVVVHAGTVDVSRGVLGPGERLLVQIGDAELEAKSSRFTIEADGDRIQRLHVDEGLVEIRASGFTAAIPSGGSWRFSPVAPPLSPPPRPTENVVAPTPSADPASTASSAKVVADVRRAPARPVVAPSLEPRPEAPTTSALDDRSPRLDDASLVFAHAIEALGRGDHEEAARGFSKFTEVAPNDPRADEADFLRVLAFERAGQPMPTRLAAARYLAAWPSGAHRADVRRVLDAHGGP